MPQVALQIVQTLGGPLGVLPAAGLNAIGIPISGGLIGDLLGIGPGRPKVPASERPIKTPTPARVHVLGKRRVHPAQMLFVNTSDSETVDVWAYCEGPVNAVTQVYLNDDPATIVGGVVQELDDEAYGDDKVLAGYNLGADPNAAHAPVVSRVPDWTNDHRGDGIVSGYLVKTGVKSKDFVKIYPRGDNVAMSLVIEGHFCHDPREPGSDPEDPATWLYTENSVLLLLWFKTYFLGNDYAARIAPVEQYWIDAADICDEAVSLDAGGTEARYRGCILFAADNNPASVESEILATFDGWLGEDENGCIKVFAGKLYAPTVSVGPSQIIDYELQEFVEDENRLNEVIVRHVSAGHDFNEVEPEPWRDDSDITERGKIVSIPLDLQVPSHTQARRLAKRAIARTNAPQRGSIRTVFSAREALAERYIDLTIEESGTEFFSGTVEVIGGERDSETGGAIIEWVAVDANVDAWNAATEDGEPAPTAAKYYLPPLTAPTIDTATGELDASGTFARIAVVFDAITEPSPTWFIRWRVDGETSYVEAEASPTSTTIRTGAVPADELIDVSISYSSGGRFSEWSADSTVDTTTAGLAPASPTELTATGAAGEAEVTWRNPSSSNLSYVKVWRNTVATFGTATDISGEIVGGLGQVMTITDTGLAAGTYYYWVAAYNAADIASSPAGPDDAVVT